ncbi:hypothetical protein MHM582_1110 [Microbacterium sp. HM58-2]|nr:hypothetical protein MHM582_1110 [Microbacterium sp. HM58-2]
MILDWLAQTPVLLAAVLVVFVPGIAVLSLIGLRGLALLALAPLVSVASSAVIALIFGAAGIGWSPLSWAIAVIALVGLSWFLARLLGRVPTEAAEPGRRWVLPAAVTMGVLVGMWRLIGYITDPAGISQTNDAVFHMNAVRFILETANASSLHVTAVVGGETFYPAAWHALVSLTVTIAGTSIPIAANMLTLVIGALIWPFGLAWLTLRATRSVGISSLAAVLSGALQTFPLLMIQWGVLFPNALSTALIPGGIALVISLPRWMELRSRIRGAVLAVLLVLVVIASIGLSQPAGLLAWGAICAIWLTSRLVASSAGRTVRTIVLTFVTWTGLGTVWFVMSRGTSGSHWPPFRGKLEVLADVLINGQVLIPFAFGVSALMMVGIVATVRQRHLRWMVAAWALLSLLYALAAAVGNGFVRGVILGPWYADPYRLAALAPILVIPLAAVGADAVVRWFARRRGVESDGERSTVVGLAGALVFMVILVLLRPVDMPAFLERTYDMKSRYVLDGDSYLSRDERALLEDLDELVEPGARVLGNPSTGTGFGYMLSGVDVYPRNWSQPQSASWEVLAVGLRDAGDDQQVCEALAAYSQPGYVLDFGLGEDGPGRFELPGMTDFDGQDGFELVAREGDATLWRITACAS